jgi:poly(hydroxyalkanoate) depolymerase family esterase
MARNPLVSLWADSFRRSLAAVGRANTSVRRSVIEEAVKQTDKHVVEPAKEKRRPPPGEGEWIAGLAWGPAGARRYRLYRPPGVGFSERLPLLVMLHGCHQDAKAFAVSTRMNKLATKERFLVLYPEQDRHANPQGCWNWYDTRSGMAYSEAATLLAAIDQATLLYPVDRSKVALAGLSAGASMAALMATRYPHRFQAVVMHSGVGPGAAESSGTAFGAMTGRRAPAASVRGADSAPWPALMVIHGDRDTVVSHRAGLAAASHWAEVLGAKPAPQRTLQRGKRHASAVTEFKVKGRVRVSHCEVAGLGHAWSGGAPRLSHSDPLGPDATSLSWAFIKRQFSDRT